MGTPTSTDDPMVEFVLGRTKVGRYPTAEEWGRIMQAYIAVLFGDMKYYGIRELREDEGQRIDRLVARDVLKDSSQKRLTLIHIESLTTAFYLSETLQWLIAEADIDSTRVIRWEWVGGDALTRIFESARYSPYLPARLINGVYHLVEYRLEEAERRIATFRDTRDALKPITERIKLLPDSAPM